MGSWDMTRSFLFGGQHLVLLTACPQIKTSPTVRTDTFDLPTRLGPTSRPALKTFGPTHCRIPLTDGWTASTKVVRLPWAAADAPVSEDPASSLLSSTTSGRIGRSTITWLTNTLKSSRNWRTSSGPRQRHFCNMRCRDRFG